LGHQQSVLLMLLKFLVTVQERGLGVQHTAARKPIHYLPRTFRNVRMIFPQRSGSLTPIDAPDARRTSGCSKRLDFSPAHPLADIFHPPYPPIASQSISRDVPFALARAFRFLMPFLEGVAEAALYCAHRTIDMLPPSLLVISLGMGAD